MQSQLNAATAQLRGVHPHDARYAGLVARHDQIAADLSEHGSSLTVAHEGVILTAGVPRTALPEPFVERIAEEYAQEVDDQRTYWGLLRTIATATVLAVVVTLLLFVMYTVLDSGTETMRSAIGNSLATAPGTPSP